MRCIALMMEKNEHLLFEPWVRYHADLFGPENLYIFDNGSDHPKVRALLDQFGAAGVNIDRSKCAAEDFARKGSLFLEYIQNMAGRADVFFPLDCDEFICYTDPETREISCDREVILAALERSRGVRDALVYKYIYQNIPARHGEYVIDSVNSEARKLPKSVRTIYAKTFFNTGTALKLDLGFHDGRTATDRRFITDLSLVHYHSKPYVEMVDAAKTKLRDRVEIENVDALRAYASPQRGNHLVKYLLMDEYEYLHSFDGDERVVFSGLESRFQALGCPLAF